MRVRRILLRARFFPPLVERGGLPFDNPIQAISMLNELTDRRVTLGAGWQIIDAFNEHPQPLDYLPQL